MQIFRYIENATVTKFRYEETVKAIDFIYALTNNRLYSDGWSKYKFGITRVATILIKRGVLVTVGNKYKKHTYKWNPSAQEPTEHFYKSVAQEIANIDSEYAIRKKAESVGLKPVKREEPKPSAKPAPKKEENAEPLWVSWQDDTTDQALWNELKRRGYIIEDNKLVKKTYLV